MRSKYMILPLLLCVLLFALSGFGMPAQAVQPENSVEPAVADAISGPPTIPMNIRGRVLYKGKNAPVGTNVTAWIDGKQCGAAKVFMYQNVSWYAIDVAADGTVPGCGLPGKTVTFRVEKYVATPTTTWSTTPILDFPISATIGSRK